MPRHNFRNLTRADLLSHAKVLEADYYAVREDARTGKEKNHAQLKFMRRNIARALTISHENSRNTDSKQVKEEGISKNQQKLPKK